MSEYENNENALGLRSILLNDLCAFFNKTSMSDTEMNAYKYALKQVDVNDLDEVKYRLLNSGRKYMPRPADMMNINREVREERQNNVIEFATPGNAEHCPICDDLGRPFVLRQETEGGMYYEVMGPACSCKVGSFFIQKHGYYFDEFPNMQFPWDREKHPRYYDCFYENALRLKAERAKKFEKNPALELPGIAEKEWINDLAVKASCTLTPEECPL